MQRNPFPFRTERIFPKPVPGAEQFFRNRVIDGKSKHGVEALQTGFPPLFVSLQNNLGI